MNSKELLERANERADKLRVLSKKLRDTEDAIEAVETGLICVLHAGEYTCLQNVFDKENMTITQGIIKANLIGFRDEKSTELEQLLGIHAVPSIPQLAKGKVLIIGEGKPLPHLFPIDTPEVIVPQDKLHEDMEQMVKEVLPDPLEKALAEILQKEDDRIGAVTKKPEIETRGCDVKPHVVGPALTLADDKSLEKYPDPKKGGYPEGMTVDVITRMYIVERKTLNQIAEHFNIKTFKVNDFLTKHNIRRTSYKKQGLPREPEETERP